MGKFILIDFKKRGEHSDLKKLGPDLLKKMDVWIANYREGTPTEVECATMEQVTIVELIQEYDTAAEKLKRVKDEVPEARAHFVKHLGWRRGLLYLNFGATVEVFKEMAVATLQRCGEMWKTYEHDLIASFPVGDSAIKRELAEFLSQTSQYIEDTFPERKGDSAELLEFLSRTSKYIEDTSTFPECVVGLDAFDDELPDGTPSYTAFQQQVMASEDKLKVASAEAIPGELEKIKDSSMSGFKLAVNQAIEKAVAGIIVDLQNYTLPHLDEAEMESLRKELIKSAEEYGESRMDA